MSKLKLERVVLGCDPEIFLSKNGKTIGSEKVIPAMGLIDDELGKVVRDGIQAELNPTSSTCRVILARAIGSLIRLLDDNCNDGVTVDFNQVVEVEKEEFDSLGEESKSFGCNPSFNVYSGGVSQIPVDPKIYMKRSTGGHIHLGKIGQYDYVATGEPVPLVNLALEQPERVVKALDLILGNTAVLVDRNEANVERRKVYGRAGEFRRKSYGVEYRTPSTFWLANYQMMSFAFGLARLAVNVVANNRDEELHALVNQQDVIDAINNNDYALALSNFDKIIDTLMDMLPDTCGDFSPLRPDNIHLFRHFISKEQSHWFPKDPLTYWLDITEERLFDEDDNENDAYNNYVSGWLGFKDFLLSKPSEELLNTKQ